MKNKKKYAFSLAEALITLLIVALISLASVPVITKKKRVLSNAHGMWMCTLNQNGNAIYYLKSEGVWHTSNQTSCTFLPPKEARNFELTIVGGGGGGASGNSQNEDFILSNGETKSFTAPGTGSYRIYLIGGGGNGGNRKNNANRCQENPGGPGSSGGFKHAVLNLTRNNTYYIASGSAGRGSNDTGGYDGTDSYIKLLSTNNILAQATGGKGGQSRRGAACGQRKTDGNKFVSGGKCGESGCAGNPGSPNGVTGWTLGSGDTKYSVPGFLCTSSSSKLSGTVDDVSCSKLLSDIVVSSSREYDYGYKGSSGYSGTRYGLPYGHGGKGQSTGQTSGPTEGGPGFVRFQYNLVTAGGGGESGLVNRPAVVPSLKRVTVYPGRGGLGAANINSNGSRGNNTTVIVEAKDHTSEKSAEGGSGGRAEAETAASAEESDVIQGKTGETSAVKLTKSNAVGGIGGFVGANASANGASLPFGDRNYFGAGGGGGGANSETWGQGSSGGSGAVIIEW